MHKNAVTRGKLSNQNPYDDAIGEKRQWGDPNRLGVIKKKEMEREGKGKGKGKGKERGIRLK
jgi:hypothetical protein